MATFYELTKITDDIRPLTEDEFQDFDPIILAQKLGISLQTYEEYLLQYAGDESPILLSHAFLSVSDDGYTINYDDNDTYALFYISHEIAHYLLKHNKDSAQQEQDANMLAMLLWAPPSFFEGKVSPQSVSLVCHVPSDIAVAYANWMNEQSLVCSHNSSFFKKKKRKSFFIVCGTLSILLISIIGWAVFHHTTAVATIVSPSSTHISIQTPIPNQEVFVTATGKKCHLASCYYIKGKTNLKKMTLKEALQEGYLPCSVCHPDIEKK